MAGITNSNNNATLPFFKFITHIFVRAMKFEFTFISETEQDARHCMKFSLGNVDLPLILPIN